MKLTQLTLAILLLAVFQQSAWAQMYKCIDRGKIRYSDTPLSSECISVKMARDITAHITTKKSSRKGIIRQIRGGRSSKGSFEKYINYCGVRYNVDPHLIRAVIRAESGFNPKAVSKKGAQGLMQLMPGTARDLKVADPFDPRQNIDGGTRYLRTMLTTFKGDKRLALAAYNAGPNRVKRKQRIPEIPETVQYVKKVLRYYKEYKNGRV